MPSASIEVPRAGYTGIFGGCGDGGSGSVRCGAGVVKARGVYRGRTASLHPLHTLNISDTVYRRGGGGGGRSEGTRGGEGCCRTCVVKPGGILRGSTTPLHPLAHYISILYTHAHPPTPPRLATHTLKKMHSVRYRCNHFVLQTFPARYTSIYIHTPQLMYASLPASSPRHAHGLGKKGILFGTATPATHTNVPCTLWPTFSNLSALKHIHLTRLFKDLWLFSQVV